MKSGPAKSYNGEYVVNGYVVTRFDCTDKRLEDKFSVKIIGDYVDKTSDDAVDGELRTMRSGREISMEERRCTIWAVLTPANAFL